MALDLLSPSRWGLSDAYRAANQVLTTPSLVKSLMRALFSDDEELRRRAADTARRVTEKQRDLLEPYADEVIGLLGASADDNWRTRGHLGLIVGRIAHTRAQRLRAATMLRAPLKDASNVVRCSGIEGFGELARSEPTLRDQAAEIMLAAQRTGTLAMRCRAKNSRLLVSKD
jgi:hypothetical protein